MAKKWLAVVLALILVCGTALAQADGWVSLYQVDNDGMLKSGLDVDDDGQEEKIFFEWYGGGSDYDASRFVQFLPGNFNSGKTVNPGQGGYPYMRPGRCYNDESGWPGNLFADGLTIYDKEYDCLSIHTGDDGVMYACVTGVVRGANGIPESYPEFFMQARGKDEMPPVQVDVQSLVQAQAGGVKFLKYPAGVRCEYVDVLGRYCFVMTQYGANSDRDTLKTCFTMKAGKPVVLDRLLNGKKVR